MTAARRGTLLALGVLALTCAATLWLPPFDNDRVNDLYVYRVFTEPVLDGGLPYREVFFEYPPLAAPAIALPGLIGTGEEIVPLGLRRLDVSARAPSCCCSAARWRRPPEPVAAGAAGAGRLAAAARRDDPHALRLSRRSR